jgi:hypothetical protein
MFRVLGNYLNEISIIRVGYHKVKKFNTQPIRLLPSLGMITY